MTIKVKITNTENDKTLFATHYDPTSTIIEPNERIDTVFPGGTIEVVLWEKNYVTLSEKKLT